MILLSGLLFIVVLVVNSQQQVLQDTLQSEANNKCKNNSQTNPVFTFKRKVNFFPNMSKFAYSPDNRLLVGLRDLDTSLYLYDPSTFQLKQEYKLPQKRIPYNVTFFKNDLFVLMMFNELWIFTKEQNSSKLNFCTSLQLTNFISSTIISSFRIQTFDDDYNDEQLPIEQKSYNNNKNQSINSLYPRQQNIRHLVIWNMTYYELYIYDYYQQPVKKLLYVNGYSIKNLQIWFMQFYDQVFLVQAVRSPDNMNEVYFRKISNLSSYQIIRYKNQSVISMNQYKARSDWNFFVIAYEKAVINYRHDGGQQYAVQAIEQSVSNLSNVQIYYDQSRMLAIVSDIKRITSVLFVDNAADGSDPNFTEKFHYQVKNYTENIASLVAFAPKRGEFLIDSCSINQTQNGCFQLYSLCQQGYYYEQSVSNYGCMKCPQAHCVACSSTLCFQCSTGFFFDTVNNCTSCSIKLLDCNNCTSYGLSCLNCSQINNFDSTPRYGECHCKEGFYLDQIICVQCQQKVLHCKTCSSENRQVKCKSCADDLHRIPDANMINCICQDYYFENQQKQCQLCKDAHCKKCQTQNFCITCDIENHYQSEALNGQCTCQDGYSLKNLVCVQSKSYLLIFILAGCGGILVILISVGCFIRFKRNKRKQTLLIKEQIQQDIVDRQSQQRIEQVFLHKNKKSLLSENSIHRQEVQQNPKIEQIKPPEKKTVENKNNLMVVKRNNIKVADKTTKDDIFLMKFGLIEDQQKRNSKRQSIQSRQSFLNDACAQKLGKS